MTKPPLSLFGLLAASFFLLSAPTAGAGPALDPAKRISQYVHDVWQITDGLPSNDVQDILQTRDGYLWLATRGGLVRFDGVSFTVFDMKNTPAFATSDVGTLREGADGSLWIGTRGAGLLRWRHGVFVSYPGSTPAGNEVRALLLDGDGTPWVGTMGGLFQLRGGRLEPAAGALASLAVADVRALALDAAGAVWIGTQQRGLFRYAQGELTRLTVADGLPANAVSALFLDPAGGFWIGTSEGVAHLAEGRFTVFDTADGLAHQEVQNICKDAAGTLWIATNGGLSRFYGGRFESQVLASELVVSLVRSVFVDREGDLWVGTYSDGLHRFKDGRITAFTAREGLTENAVWSLFADRRQRLWVGHAKGSIDRIEGSEVVAPALRDLPSTSVYSLFTDGDGDGPGVMWAGTDHGLARHDGRGWQLFDAGQGMPSNRVRIVYADPAEPGTLWLANIGGGLSRFRDGELTRFARTADLSHPHVRALLRDREGALWIGTEIGLNRLAGDELTVFTTANGLSGNSIRSLFQSADDTLWIGSRGGGLMRFRDGDFTAYTTRDGLPHNDAWAILEDDQGHLWWSSDQGMSAVATAELEAYDAGRLAQVPVRLYGKADGLKSLECNGIGFPSAQKTADGRLWFACMGGAVRIDPEPPAAEAPPVVIETLSADGAAVDLAGPAQAGGALPVRLAPGRGNLEIRYTALSLRDPTRIVFRYRLVGYDRAWVDAGARRTAFYTNLSPGTYRFEVEAANPNAGWSGAHAALWLALAPHFYQTWWFYAGCGLLFGAVVVHGFRRATRRVHARNRRLLEEIAQRKRAEADRESFVRQLEAKNAELERFTYTVSHDLKSPLVTIKGFLGLLRKDVAAGDAQRVDHDLERISGAADKMHRLLEELLELSRIGRLAHEPEEVPLREIVDEALELVAGTLTARGAEVEVAADLPTVVGDRLRLLEVYQNLIENAARFMGDQPAPRIEVGAHPGGGDGPIFYVRDNGIGIEPRFHEKVFGLFERLDPKAEGTGIGLALVQRIVELHGGRVWVESAGQGHGSTFCFTLPAAIPKRGPLAAAASTP